MAGYFSVILPETPGHLSLSGSWDRHVYSSRPLHSLQLTPRHWKLENLEKEAGRKLIVQKVDGSFSVFCCASFFSSLKETLNLVLVTQRATETTISRSFYPPSCPGRQEPSCELCLRCSPASQAPWKEFAKFAVWRIFSKQRQSGEKDLCSLMQPVAANQPLQSQICPEQLGFSRNGLKYKEWPLQSGKTFSLWKISRVMERSGL